MQSESFIERLQLPRNLDLHDPQTRLKILQLIKKNLPSEYAQLWYDNAVQQITTSGLFSRASTLSYPASIQNAINYGFNWPRSLEGNSYWSKLYINTPESQFISNKYTWNSTGDIAVVKITI